MTITTSSVIVVAHNNWPVVDLAVASALGQTRAPDQVIVVDNGSADGSAAALTQRYGDRIQIIRQSNRLDSGGYNAGIRAATGDVIQLLDGDDLLDRDKLRLQIAALDAHPDIDIAYGDVRRFRNVPGDGSWPDEPSRDYDDVLGALCAHAGTVHGLCIHSVLLRRRVVERIGMFDEAIWGADYDYWFRAAASGCRFLYVPDSLVYYRQWSGQMSADMGAMAARSERTLEKALTYIAGEPYRSDLERHLNRFRFRVALHGKTPAERARALDMIRETHRRSPAQISWLRYAIAAATVYSPEWLRNQVRTWRVGAWFDRVVPR